MILYVVFLPLLSFLIIGLNIFYADNASKRFAQFLSSGFMLISASISWWLFYQLCLDHNFEETILIKWFDVGGVKAHWSFLVDKLTATMLIVVTTVSAVVHLYSIGYMAYDPAIPRFMSYLSLFTFFMLMLVTSDNIMQLFFGWEGVGLCSYLLIGFWYHKESANNAAMKAFLVNRMGDFAFIIGIFAIFNLFGSIEFVDIFNHVVDKQSVEFSLMGYTFNAIEFACMLLFIGSMGKSAQIGLHTWLPDAMEGPTPVSALIHAATMVTAGVFLIIRFSPLFEYANFTREVITYVGALTAIFAASVAITQNDIKKIIAYSTCSQLGYMFFACGVSAYAASIFHLMTHAFFKALLFLGAGSVIHAIADEQDITKMGGLFKKIPITYVLMLIGSLALAGIYPFAGYYSKDIILESVVASNSEHGWFAYITGIAAAFLTALYSWRLLIIVFHKNTRISDAVMKKVHEPGFIMLVPLFILAIGALFSGIFGYDLGFIDGHKDFWQNSIFMLDQTNILLKAESIDYIYKKLPLVAGILGIITAYITYYIYPDIINNTIIHCFQPIHKFLVNKWYFDEIYDWVIVRPIKRIAKFSWLTFDIKIIDGLGPNGLAKLVNVFSGYLSKIQSGFIYHYALAMIVGVVLLLTWFVYNFVI